MSSKICTKCGKMLPITAFHHHRLTKDGYAYQCKECNRERSRIFTKTAAGVYSRIKGRVNHRKKTKIFKDLNISRNDFIEWYDAQERKCAYCDVLEEDLTKFSDPFNDISFQLTVDCMDNNIGYEVGNMVLACRRCNSLKSDLLSFDEMREFSQKYIKPKWQAKLEGNANEV